MNDHKRNITISDLARELNTTASTVSRALQDHPRISERMKRAVRELAERLNYQPNPVANQLRTGKSYVLAVVVPRIDRKFFASAIGGIEGVAFKNGYNVVISQSNDNYDKERAILEAFQAKKVDALAISLAAETTDYSHFEPFIQQGVPIVFFDRIPEELAVSKVEADNFEGAYRAVEHLITQGCRRIGHLAGPLTLSVYRNRLQGYKQALTDYGLPIEEELIVPDSITFGTGQRAADYFLSLAERPDAVYSAGDFSAMGMLLHFKKCGVRIPEEIAVVGFANESFDDFSDPGLTSVDLFSKEMGRRAAEILFDEMEQPQQEREPRHIKITPELVVRGSSVKKREELEPLPRK